MNSTIARILYTEDNTDTRELVSLVLGQKNCEVVTAENAKQALHLAKTERFDLYILDNWLPDASGIELCTRLRKFDPRMPILFFSGATSDEEKKAAFSSGAQAYLSKPASVDELIDEVFRLVGKPWTARAKASSSF
jgi:DNA-binding response OmpR family regulator